jgi:hypothetical protein
VEIHPETARKHGIEEGDWVYIESPRGRVKERAKFNDGIDSRVDVAEHGWWYPEIKDPGHGWDISNINILMDNSHDSMDPAIGSTNLRVCFCNIAPTEEAAGLIEKETLLEPKKFKGDNLSDFNCGSGFQPRLTRSGRYP